MCYDISFTVKMRQLSDLFPDLIFDNQLDLDFGPIDHIQGPGIWPDVPIIYRNRTDGKLHARLMKWSVIRYTDTDPPENIYDPEYVRKRNLMMNIRSERVLDDPSSYWFKIKTKRCLFATTATFEHREVIGWQKRVPYLIRPKDQEIAFILGLYSVVEYVNKITGETFEPIWTCALLTTDANSDLKNIHNSGDNAGRMTFYVPFEMALQFLQQDISFSLYHKILEYRIAPADLEYYPVHPIRNVISRPDNLPKTAFWNWGNLPALGLRNPKKKDDEQNMQGVLAF